MGSGEASAMASASRVRQGLTLEEFLRRPEIDEHPYLEFIDGRIEAKAMPRKKHAIIQGELTASFNQFAKPARLGYAFPELRCTFAGRSIVPDVVFLLRDHIQTDERGRPRDETPIPPDIHVEILSPDRHAKKSRTKLTHSTANGCPLGWLIDPDRETIHVYRTGQPPMQLPADGVMEGEPVLPGFRLPVAEVFGWLILDL
jgi:Uma2 family endonuclease